MDFKDYYKTLEVDRGATTQAISTAFRKLARKYHPDVNKTPGAEDKFKEINEAYQVLSDAERRARYDQMYEAYQHGGMDWQQAFGRGAQETPGGWTVTFGGDAAGLEDLLGGQVSDFFRQFFGGDVAGQRPGGGRSSAGRSRRSTVDLEEMMRPQPTPPQAEAPITVTLEDALAGAQKSVAVQLTGKTRRFDVTIPKGVRSGQKIRLPGALDGDDLYLTVEVAPHPYFERREDDLIIEVPVTPSEAVLGATIEVPTLEGKVDMTIHPGTQNGQVYRLRGQGMPRRDGKRGDQLVHIKVVLPTKPSAREKQLYEELAKLRSDNPRAQLGRK
ncbi:MAG TPA: DnaJ C-terminal domain-containing protein [bacterium]